MCGEKCPSHEGLFEFRNFNQYIVAPGSTHPDFDLIYRWLDDTAVVSIPDFLIEFIFKHAQQTQREMREVVATPQARVRVGLRNELLKFQGGRLAGMGLDFDSLLNHFRYLNQHKFAEPKSEWKIKKDAENMFRAWHEPIPPLIIVGEVDPAADADVDGAQLLSDIEAFLKKYFHFAKPSQAPLTALWVIHTYVFDLFTWTPYLCITSPTKRCGKSLLLELLGYLVRDPITTANISAAALYRIIEAKRPTLLFDETDAIFGGDATRAEDLRCLLNAGAKRGSPAIRCKGQNKDEVAKFEVFCPKALSGIGMLPDTIADRSLILRVQRKAKSVELPKVKERIVSKLASPLVERTNAFVATIREELESADPAMPDGLNGRQEDMAEVLLAIADAAGGDWPSRTRRALVEICGVGEGDDEDTRVMLLEDVRTIFLDQRAEVIPTQEILKALHAMEERSWATWGKGNKPITGHGLTRLLKGFELEPKQPRLHKVSGAVFRGYAVSAFSFAFSRYLGVTSVTSDTTRINTGENAISASVTEFPGNTSQNGENASKNAVGNAGNTFEGEIQGGAEGQVVRGPAGLPWCPKCQSYALYREADGTYTCETCQLTPRARARDTARSRT